MRKLILPTVAFVAALVAIAGCQPRNRASPPSSTNPPTSPYVVVLGTAQDGGFPQAGCTKVCCKRAHERGIKEPVTALGIVDPATGSRWLIDATPDFPGQLRALLASPPAAKLAKLRGIFLTHGHIGHYTGLIHLGREVMGARQVPVYAMPRMRSFLCTAGPWSQLVALKNIVLRAMHAGRPVQLTPTLRVTPLLVPHRDEFTETVGFRIEGPARSVLFIPDIDKWGKWHTPLHKALDGVDVALLDGTFFDQSELPGRDMSQIPHPFIEETIARLQNSPQSLRKKVMFIHLNHTNSALEPQSEATSIIARAGMAVARKGQRLSL